MAITTTTVAQFRKSKPQKLADGYIITDAGTTPSLWFPAAVGAADADNGGTFLRDGLKRGIARSYEGLRSAAMFGMRVGTNISERLQRYVSDLTPEEHETVLTFQHGIYEVSGVDLGRTALGLVCPGGFATFRGARILRWNDGQGKVVQLSRMGFLGYGKKEYAADLDDNDPLLMNNALLFGNGVVRMDAACRVWESPGHGTVLEGWELDGRPLTNVSGSVVMGQNTFSRCSGQGLYVVGNNANMVTNFANDFRDNAGGSRDASQVGGFSAAGLYHLNLVKGNNAMDSNQSLGAVIANYHEFTEQGRGNSYAGQTFVREATGRSGAPIIGPHVDYIDNNHPFNWRQDAAGSFSFLPKDDSPTAVMRYGAAGTHPDRPTAEPWLESANLLIAGKATSRPVASIEAAQKQDHFSQRGDTVLPTLEGLAHACVRGGNGGRTLTGITASVTPNSGGNLVLKGDVSQLPMGVVVEVNPTVNGELRSYAVQIDSLHQDPNSGLRAIGPYQLPVLFTDQPVSFPVPQFQAAGQ